jgi:hypothetical protein
MESRSEALQSPTRPLPIILFIAIAQGIVLYALHLSLEHKHWPATDPAWLIALYAAAIYVPLTADLLVVHVLQRAAWVLIAVIAALFFCFGWFHGSDVVGTDNGRAGDYAGAFSLALELILLWLMILPFVQSRLATGRWRPEYRQLFALAWRNQLTLAEAALFTGLFWSLLFLWQALFHELKIDFFRDLFRKPIFAYPITTVAFGVALQLIGSLEHWSAVVLEQILNVLKWLGIVAGVILTLFTVALLLKLPSLVLVGEKTINAAWLLWLVAVVVLFVNAAYRDGSVDSPYPRSISVAVRMMTPLLIIVALTALYSVALRTRAYGLTVQRFWALVVAAFAIIYAVGYSWAAFKRGRWMSWIGQINVAAAIALIAVIALALTPMLSPYRLSADSQYQRALAWNPPIEGRHAPPSSPFHYLRFSAGTYGLRELHRLAAIPAAAGSADVPKLAAAALAETNEYMPMLNVPLEDQLAKTPVYPSGRGVPADLRRALLEDFNTPGGSMFRYQGPGNGWIGIYVDLNGSHDEQFVLFRGCATARVYQHAASGWRAVGTMTLHKPCQVPEMEDALHAGAIAPMPRIWNDLKIGDLLYRFEPVGP